MSLILFRPEACVDHVMQVCVLWVKDAGDAFLLLAFPLISTLTSPLKIKLNNFNILQWEAGLFYALLVATWFQGSVAHKDKLVVILVFSFSLERIRIFMEVCFLSRLLL